MQAEMAPSQENPEVIFNELVEAARHILTYGMDPDGTDGTTWNYHGGIWGGHTISDGTVTLTPSTSNYLVVNRSTGALTNSTSSTNWDNEADYAHVYKIIMGASAPGTIEDHRGGPNGVHGQIDPSAIAPVAEDVLVADVYDHFAVSPKTVETALQELAEAVEGIAPGTGDILFAATARVLARKTAGAGAGEECTLSEILDFIGSAAQGDILYRGSSAWARLAAGTSGQFLKTNGAGANPAWATPGVSGTPIEIQIAVSDETTALSTGTAKITFRLPCAVTLTGVRASLTTAQTSGSIFTVDVNEAGTSVLSTKLTIDNTEKTSVTAATAPVISDSSLADDAEMTIDIDQVGDGTAKGLKVTLIGTRT